jgi:anti-sigma B factor antagonist
MNYRITHRGAVQVLHLFRIMSDLDNRLILDEVNRNLQEDRLESLIIDLSQLEYMDSNGLNLLLALWRRVRQFGCQMLLTEPLPPVRRLLELTRLQAVFTFISNQEAALTPAS